MDKLNELRRQALLRRDQLLAAARDEYRETIADIDRMARLFGAETKKPAHRTLAQIVIENMPHDHPILLPDLAERLKVAEPGRVFATNSLSGSLHNLEKHGEVIRVGYQDGRALWAVKGYKHGDPYGCQSVRQIVGALLRELGPLTLPEIVVELQARGYRPGVDARTVADAVKSGLHKAKDEFIRDGNSRRWALVE